MAVTNYYTVVGEIIGEHAVGQSRLDYLNDAFGSVVATVSQSLTVVSTSRYKPYGADLATTGTMPMYGWVGSLGSRRTSGPHAEQYNRARHFGNPEGRWTTVDPIWSRPFPPSHAFPFQPAPGGGEIAPYPQQLGPGGPPDPIWPPQCFPQTGESTMDCAWNCARQAVKSRFNCIPSMGSPGGGSTGYPPVDIIPGLWCCLSEADLNEASCIKACLAGDSPPPHLYMPFPCTCLAGPC